MYLLKILVFKVYEVWGLFVNGTPLAPGEQLLVAASKKGSLGSTKQQNSKPAGGEPEESAQQAWEGSSEGPFPLGSSPFALLAPLKGSQPASAVA